MSATMLDPQVEFTAAQRVRTATLLERAVHGNGEWTVMPEDESVSIPLTHRVENGIPFFVGTYKGEDRFVSKVALCSDGTPVRWFYLNLQLSDGDGVTVNFT